MVNNKRQTKVSGKDKKKLRKGVSKREEDIREYTGEEVAEREEIKENSEKRRIGEYKKGGRENKEQSDIGRTIRGSERRKTSKEEAEGDKMRQDRRERSL